MRDYCPYCDFSDLDDDPEDCICEVFCGEPECSGDVIGDEEEDGE